MSQKNYTIKQIDQMINEEYTKAKKAMVLKKELDALNEEEDKLRQELGIDEVTVGGRHSGSEWYEKDVPSPNFEKIGSHLKEMEDEEAMGMEMDTEMDTEMDLGYFETKLGELGKELDLKIGDEGSDEEMEMDMEMGDDESSEEMEMGDDEEIDENSDAPEVLEIDSSGIMGDEEGCEDEDETVDEQAGDAVSNAAEKKVKGEDGMKKVDNKNSMADKMYEGKKGTKSLISEVQERDESVLMEGLDKKGQAEVKSQLERMRRLTFNR